MLNDTSLIIIFLMLGILFGSIFPGLIAHLTILYKRMGLTLRLLWAFIKSIGIFLLLVLFFLLLIGTTVDLLGVPMAHEPSNVALGLGVLAGLTGGTIALITGFFYSRKKSR